jgi:ubiquinone/menaquinone biosynthesis C-methylase UbiE
MTRTPQEIKEAVHEAYRSRAITISEGGSCCGPSDGGSPDASEDLGTRLYEALDTAGVPDTALMGSMGCGNPTAIAALEPGQRVLDLGSGGGLDAFLASKAVGPTGFVYGVDMTDEMLDLARRNQAEAGIENIEFLKGEIESIPLPDDSVDVIISNCVINLSADKPAVFREAHRVLPAGGRFAVTDIVTTRPFTAEEQADLTSWAGCIAGALTIDEFTAGLSEAGFRDIEVKPTHDVGSDAVSAEITARA